ncbi:porin family protein [Maribellus maritimus]|uniref:porin family protein n=1 Tax=Maribellus maritimus TaxID=2870838 RepID=UPI001EEA9D85|nr:porin family protein [Maribellus maritimus]MCG6191415.1 PorT family protein [Maribellus maritimus]
MKTISILLLVLCLFIKVNAQVSLAPKAGVNMARFIGNDNDKDPQRIVLPQVGCIVNIDFNETFALQPTLLYSVKGEKMKSYEGTHSKYYFHYLEMPVNAVYSITLVKNKFQVFAGPYWGYCLKANLESGGINTSNLSVGNSDSDVYKPFDFGYNAGVGYRFRNLQVQAGYAGSFATISNYGDLKNSIFSVTFAYFLGLSRKE